MQYKAVAKNENNLTEKDHASRSLGIFASKSASDVGIASWNYFSLVTAIHIAVADMNFVTRSPSCTLVRNSAMPTYFKDLAAWLPSRLAPKKSAFTLAEVLITLGIIGVVAALTLPTVIQNYQKQVTVTKLKKAYSMLGQVAQKSIADNGAIDFVEGDLLDEGAVKKFFNTYWLSYFKGVDVFPDGKKPYRLNGNTVFYKHVGGLLDSTNVYTAYSAGRIFFNTADGISYYVYIVKWINNKYNDKGELISQDAAYDSKQMVYVDLNGIKPPNTFGKDAFVFYVDFSKGIVRPNQGICNNTYSTGCAGKIMRDGWQIKSDYPW